MSQPVLHHIECPVQPGQPQTFRMAYWQWGPVDAGHVVLAVHGLTRQGRDFDVLARALLARAQALGHGIRVVCPDVAGRGHSGWLPDAALYQPLTYLGHMQALLAQLHRQAPLQVFDWVGTSMGGLIGMLAAVQPQSWPQPLHRLVLNDVGPVLEWAGIERIRGYVGHVGPFPSLGEGLGLLREALVGFGPHTEAQWRDLNTPMFRPAPGYHDLQQEPVILHYDPAIALPVRRLTREAHEQGASLMQGVYGQIRCQTLLLRGAQSELLSAEAALAMTASGPRPRRVEFASVGHAPTLVPDDQVQAVCEFIVQA